MSRVLFYGALRLREIGRSRQRLNLTIDEKKLVDEIDQSGVTVIPNFLNNSECASLIDIFDNLEEKYSVSFESDKRIFGIERISKLHNELFATNKMIKKVGAAAVNSELDLQCTLAGKLYYKDKNTGSGGGWHRDSFSKQFKAIVYLTDVSEDNGPFQYIERSHQISQIHTVLFKMPKTKNAASTRYSESDIRKIVDICKTRINTYTASAGTLILVDPRGLHRGMPIKIGKRYALTNYLIAKKHHIKNGEIDERARKTYERYVEENES